MSQSYDNAAPYEGDMDSNATINYRNEVDEWTEVNRKLKNHGLHIIKLLHPSDVALMTGRTVCLDSAMSKALRDNVLSLVADCDHRQTLIQDLIITNNKLKEDLEKQTNLTSKYHGRMKELQVLLESSRSRVQELEEEEGSILVEEEKLVNTKKAMHAKCKQLTQRCQSQEKEIERLKTKLQKMAEEEDKRANRQSQVFQEFKKRTARAHSVMDEKLLDIIDAYEKQVLGLQKQIEFYKSAELGESRDFDDEDQSIFSLQTEPSNNMKSLVRTYEKQLRKAQDKIKQLENDRELIRLDAGSRPQLQDYRVAQQRMKKLEKLLAVHNISIPGEKPNKDPYRLKKKYSTKLEDLDYLPLDFCRQHLRDICTETDAEDLEEVIPLLQKQKEYLETSQRYEQFCRCVQDICQDEEDQQGRLLSPSKKKNVLTEKSLQRTVAKLQCWKQDQDSLQELQISINRLGERVAPWLKIRMSGDSSMTQIISAVDKIVYDDGIIREKDGKEHPSRTVLENIVQHFQTLFDVPSVSGVFPRMNDIYTKLGEVHNVLNTLRNLLGLERDAKSSEIVDAVGHLCQTYRNTTSKQLKSLLQTEDLEGVIRRLEEHSDFFPAFQEIVRKLFEILDIQRMDQIIPAVRALKLLAG
ncbi:centrosomal protein of 70 kDa-like isoform X1 [Crassostrea angulata]|uniref:centrosomal protein of 70 kDa-like isoform X1 n=1 Tax=Magallana angulata TaxID=2784310 RepID=UPI0022B0FD2A|nr:centrosomal protein of 70 kDa-like isoform X1 [Crassostrea angulata]